MWLQIKTEDTRDSLPLSIPPFYNGVEWGIFFKNHKEWTTLLKKKQYIYVEDLTCMDEKLKEAYMINQDTDYFEIIINQKTNNAAKQRKELTFTQYLDDYADKYVTKEYCESMKRELCKESLKEHFEKEEDFHFAR